MKSEIEHPEKYHAGLYIRLSKEDDVTGPSESVTNQLSLLEQFASEHRLEVFDTYIDDGWSGTNFDRPNFKRLIRDIKLQKVNMVITKDLSRLGRDYILTGHYMERFFPENKVRYISLLDGIDTGVESTANDITPFRAIMNDMYAKDISKKIKSVKRDKQRKGQFIGGKPVYGYKKHPTEKNKIIADEHAAPVVRHIFGMALEGMSCRQIAVKLNEKGILTPALYANLTSGRKGPYAGLWSSERVSDMLQNETYIGSMVQGRSIKISYKSKKCQKMPRESWMVVENTHEPLIDKETFEKVGLLLKSRRHTRSRTYDFPLKGLIFCHECGCPLAVLNRKNAKGEDVLYFVCRTYQRFTRAGVCTCHSIKAQAVMDAVTEVTRELCGKYICETALIGKAESAVEATQKPENGESGALALQSLLDGVTANLDRIYMDKLEGILDDADFERIYARAKAQRSALEEKLLRMSERESFEDAKKTFAMKLVEDFIGSAYTNRELLCSLIERVELTETKKIIIKFRFEKPSGFDDGRSLQ